MSAERVQLDQLIKLAHDKSSNGRAQLIETITDLFLSPEGRLSEHERALMTDILAKLIASIETDVRRNLSEALLRSRVEMRELHVLLANDEVEVAGPILRESTLLQDPDLIDIVRMRSDEHRLAIAVRERVSEQLSDALIEHGGEDVIEVLIRNQNAEISRRAMQYLVGESRRSDRFQEPLLLREDLPADLAHKMYWWVAGALRKRILTDFDVDSIVLDDAIEEAARRALAEREAESSASARAIELVDQLAQVGQLNGSFLVQSLRQQKINIFVAGIAKLANVSFKIAWRIISDRGFESFIIAAKAIGLDRNQTTHVVLLLADVQNPVVARRPEVLDTIIELYDQITPERAAKVLRIWQRDVAYQQAIDVLQGESDPRPDPKS